MTRWAVLSLVLGGCTAGDVDTDDPFSDPPDISGRYQATLVTLTGCDAPQPLVQPWFEGPLSIDGEADALSFDFGDDLVLAGSVDADFGFQAVGDLVVDERPLEVDLFGVAYLENENWVLDGDLSIVVDGDCEITGEFECVQVAS